MDASPSAAARFTVIRRWALTLLIAGGVFALSLYPPSLVSTLSYRLTDTYYRFNTHTPDPQVVFVSVDHASVKRFGRWPWERQTLANLLASLARAEVVALDLIFGEPSQFPEEDLYLAEILATMNTITGFLFNGPQGSRMTESELSDLMASALVEVKGSHLPFIQSDIVELNLPEIRQAAVLTASLNTLPDDDELFRRYPIAFVTQGALLPTLGVQAMRLYKNQDLMVDGQTARAVISMGGVSIPVDTEGFAALNFYPVEQVAVVSFADLDSDALPSNYFEGKVVVVGITEAGITDIRATPMGQLPGPVLHYTFISNLLGDHLLHSSRLILGLLILLAALLPLGGERLVRSLGGRVLVGLATAICIYLLGVLAYRWTDQQIAILYPLLALLLSSLNTEYLSFRYHEGQSRFLRRAFTSYLSPHLLEQLSSDKLQLQLGGTTQYASYLFCDIRNFSALSERLQSSQLVALINNLFTPLTAEILGHQGTLDKYIGDSIVAIFNAPVEIDDHEYQACMAALSMMERLAEFNLQQHQQGGAELDIGIGINSGEAHIGNMGSTFRFNYTAIGDAVNLASRIEGLNKVYETHILIGESTYQAVKERLACSYIDTVLVKGKIHKEPIYQLLGP